MDDGLQGLVGMFVRLNLMPLPQCRDALLVARVPARNWRPPVCPTRPTPLLRCPRVDCQRPLCGGGANNPAALARAPRGGGRPLPEPLRVALCIDTGQRAAGRQHIHAFTIS